MEHPLPARVQGALGELVGVAQEGLLALSVGVGLGVLAELLVEEEVSEVVCPPDISASLAAAASRTYISPALVSEAAVHQLVCGGHLPANIAKVTGLMRERRDAMLDGLRHMPEGTRCVPPAGGFFCWLTLPEGLSAGDLFADAERAGISYVKGSDCFLEGGERSLRLAYSGVSPAEIDEGMERLGAVFRATAATIA
jgi:DNA-binding transcriptional MocR family regulator